MLVRRIVLLCFLASLSLPVLAYEGHERQVEVVEVSGLIDTRLAEFLIDRINAAPSADVEALILQVNSPGVVADPEVFSRLLSLVADPPVPLVSWVGPAPAVAYGGALQLVMAAPVTSAAVGAEVGYGVPTFSGKADTMPLVGLPQNLVASASTVDARSDGPFDLKAPAPRQLIQELNNWEVVIKDDRLKLTTVQPFVGEDGSSGVTNLPTVFHEPDLWTSFLRLGARPETTFFFLAAALTVGAFEFFAIGPGLAALAAAVAMVPAGYGLAILPIRWWAVALAVVSLFLLSASYQRGSVAALGALGVSGLVVSGLFFTDASPQLVPGLGGVLLTVAGVAFFFFLAMPTVARSRFSTQTIDRRGMIGREGVALSDLDPIGEVEVEGARWTARGHRGEIIKAGQPVRVSGVDGTRLDVEPAKSAKI